MYIQKENIKNFKFKPYEADTYYYFLISYVNMLQQNFYLPLPSGLGLCRITEQSDNRNYTVNIYHWPTIMKFQCQIVMELENITDRSVFKIFNRQYSMQSCRLSLIWYVRDLSDAKLPEIPNYIYNRKYQVIFSVIAKHSSIAP